MHRIGTPGFIRKLSTGLAFLAMLPLAAQAGVPAGSITFTPAAGATPVPTLGGVMLLLLALLLAFVAFTHLRRQRAKMMLMLCLAGGSLLSAAGGVTLIERATAGLSGLTISDSQGETLPIFPNTFNEYTNDTSVPMGVQSVQLPSSCPPNSPVDQVCTSGLELAQGEQCQINCALLLGDRSPKKAGIVGSDQSASGLLRDPFQYRGDEAVYVGVTAPDMLNYMPTAVAIPRG